MCGTAQNSVRLLCNKVDRFRTIRFIFIDKFLFLRYTGFTFLSEVDKMQRNIRISAKGLIIRDGKMAAIRIKDGEGEWYIMPGGGQESEETLPEAVCREIAEELGIRVRCGELLFVVEGVHGESFHRVDMVFACEYLGEISGAELHADTNQAGVDWLDIKTLNTSPLYPSRLRRQIMNYCEGKPHRIYLGNEEAGDPEVTD